MTPHELEKKKLFIVYDGRAMPREKLSEKVKDMIRKQGEAWAKYFFPADTDKASVLVSCDSLKEARSYKGYFGDGNCIYQYDIVEENLKNETFVEEL